MNQRTSIDVVRVDADHLDVVSPAWDAAVDAAPALDPFCASSVWSFSAARSFDDAGEATVVTDGHSFAGLRSTVGEDGRRLLVGLDPIWGFASPIVGHPIRAAQLLEVRMGLDDHDLVVVTGQSETNPLTAGLVRVLGADHRLLQGPIQERLRADLSEGVDAWFGRRSSRFRQRIRQVCARTDDAGITIVDCSALAPDAAMARILAIEARSWKGREDTGLAAPALADFYRRMVWRLAASDQLRLMVARRHDIDVGFVLGGVRSHTYRGLQLSHTTDVADLGVGHLLQWRQIQALEGTGIDVYDLGMDMAYKRRWADRVDETFAVIIAG